jgi:hypothetical protein
MSATGYDVSKYQTSTPILTGKSFLFVKATGGLTPDPLYARHIANARKAGLVTGAYHFGYNFISAAAQARAFYAAAGNVDFYFLDVEGRYAQSSAQVRAFFAEFRRVSGGKKIGLYHSLSGFPELGQDYNWVAYWSNYPPSINWTFWQYRGSPLDLDRFIGTDAQLRALVAPTAPPQKYRVVISGPTRLYSKVGGTWITSVRSATYTCVLVRYAGNNWWRMVDGKRKGQAFKNSKYTTRHAI